MAARILLLLGALTVLSLGAGLVSGAQATFTGQIANPGSRYAFTALYAPSALTATPSGHDVALSWNAGTNGNGYSVLGAANGTSSNCTGTTFTTIGSAAGNGYTDTGRYTPQGTYYCYQVKTSYAAWTSVNANPTAAAQLGFVAAAVVDSNGGTAGRLDTGDRIVLTFNQAVNTGTGPGGTNTVCSSGATIVLGATATSGSCSASETNNLGALTGGSSGSNGRWNATWAWGAGNTVLTITLGTRVSGNGNVTTSGTWTFNPNTTPTKLQSTAGAFHICDTNAGGGTCLPAATGSF